MSKHLIILIDAEKTFGKIQSPFLIKILSKVRIEEKFLNLIKDIYEKCTVSCLMGKY